VPADTESEPSADEASNESYPDTEDLLSVPVSEESELSIEAASDLSPAVDADSVQDDDEEIAGSFDDAGIPDEASVATEES
jgi:hypothetical protein